MRRRPLKPGAFRSIRSNRFMSYYLRLRRLSWLLKVHYPRFDSNLLLSAGNDQRLLVWDHRQFEHRSDHASRTRSGGEDRGGGDSSSGGEKLKQSGKKKGKRKGANKQKSASAKVGQSSGYDAASTNGEETGQGSAGGAGGAKGAPQEDDDVVRCSRPLLSMRLEEKPNWVTSLATPYPAIAIADTSSVAKILRRHESA